MNSPFLHLYGKAFIETATEEEIDDLFSQLECVKPPDSMVESIMNAVARLPQYEGAASLDDESTALAM